MQKAYSLLHRITSSHGIWGAAGAALLITAALHRNYLAFFAAIVGLIPWLVGLLGVRRAEATGKKGEPRPHLATTPATPAVAIRTRPKTLGVQPRSPSALVNEMMLQGRYSVLLRPEVLSNLSQHQADQAAELLTQQMAVIRGGRVSTHPNGDDARRTNQVLEVHPFFIDRHTVTNGAFQEFVDLDGYRKPELWSADVRDSLELFIDLTNHPAPRSWSNGRHDDSMADHPVTGISWYEADAFARWAGKRLPSDAEWVKAALSPRSSMVSSAPRKRYPWGNAYAKGKANLWSTQRAGTVAVAEFPEGGTSEGVRQMVGNVWEWTVDPLATWLYSGELTANCIDFRSLRGGAFDTYVEAQASPLAASGDSAFARKHNIGFRCVLDLDAVPPSVVPVV